MGLTIREKNQMGYRAWSYPRDYHLQTIITKKLSPFFCVAFDISKEKWSKAILCQDEF